VIHEQAQNLDIPGLVSGNENSELGKMADGQYHRVDLGLGFGGATPGSIARVFVAGSIDPKLRARSMKQGVQSNK